jgi:hypothetical protein
MAVQGARKQQVLRCAQDDASSFFIGDAPTPFFNEHKTNHTMPSPEAWKKILPPPVPAPLPLRFAQGPAGATFFRALRQAQGRLYGAGFSRILFFCWIEFKKPRVVHAEKALNRPRNILASLPQTGPAAAHAPS